MTSLESFIVNMGHSISNCQAHKLLCHDLWEELYVLGLRSDATLCNREILVGRSRGIQRRLGNTGSTGAAHS
jgi:hypothetical protein